MEKNNIEELNQKIKEKELEIKYLENNNRLLELDILKKKLMIEKLELLQMKD